MDTLRILMTVFGQVGKRSVELPDWITSMDVLLSHLEHVIRMDDSIRTIVVVFTTGTFVGKVLFYLKRNGQGFEYTVEDNSGLYA